MSFSAERASTAIVTSAVEANAPRFRNPSRHGHVESYFLRANHPQLRQAVWLKATVFVPRDGSESVAEVWCIVFDGEAHRVWAYKRTVALAEANVGMAPLSLGVGGCRFELGEGAGRSEGALDDGSTRVRWRLGWERPAQTLARPLCLFPHRWMLDASFPKSKLVTPHPVLRMSGTLWIDDRALALDGWWGMQGHNWGREHAYEYAWGQALFLTPEGDPHCMVEGFSSRVKVGGLLVPRMSALVVRRGQRDYRFNRIFDPWRQRASIDGFHWSVRLRGKDGEAQLTMTADPGEVACLGYANPNGSLSYCMNSKLAFVQLRVNPVNEDGFECTSEAGGAFELLSPEPHPDIERMV